MRRSDCKRVLAAGMIFLAFTTWGTYGFAETLLSDGYVLEDYQLRSTADLVDICTLGPEDADHVAARAFCYGYFEGAYHYDKMLSSAPGYEELVCSPKGTTRTQAVEAFVSYIKANPQHKSEPPLDGVFRALIAKWPCS